MDENNLTLVEIEKIVRSLKNPLASLLITGGEPFMHPQLVEICKTFDKINKPLNFNFMTNGNPTSKIIETSKSIIKSVNANVHFQVSIDGTEDVHDSIRGKKGCFNEAVNTLCELKKLTTPPKPNHNITVHILTVVSKLNFKSLHDISKFAINELKIPITFEFARGNEMFKNNPLLSKCYNPSDADKTLLTAAEMDKTYNEIKKIYALQKTALDTDLSLSLNGIKKGIELVKKQRKIVTCVAGNQIGTLYPDGKVAGCELIESSINLRDFDYDFYELWKSKEMDDFRTKIKNCYCIHSCFLQASLQNSIKYGFFYHTGE